ncbi:hypothetical protein B5C05_01750 [Staphylococcus delphini]|nr:hypothetical protein B5C05_01750 [Staphylococcus delphini]
MRKTIERLLNSELSSNSIAVRTGVSQAVISKLRNGKKELGNLTLNSAEKLFEYQKEMEKVDTWIVYRGRTADMNKSYIAEGSTYEEVYNNFVDKYGYDVLDEDIYEIQLLKKNGENLDDYDVDSDGINNYDKLDEFRESDYVDLEDYDYRELFENSSSQVYYHEFEITHE